ncbi:hypothetical protein OS493_027817 [Desmophyllum pertusum]|uniref:Uncharacterized protein n=1 Tax=Desmophyllum pertusum TaxID=174260 RepID=A0A9X0CRS4_9CNID|nr:hypothetical protein OS493_027817 [Desmophyllum pertusum]
MACLLFKKFAVFKLTFLYAILTTDLWFSAIIEASRSGCSNELGMQSRKIKQSQLSCYTYHKGWEANKGRLHNPIKSWCSDTNDPMNEYFQIDLAEGQTCISHCYPRSCIRQVLELLC